MPTINTTCALLLERHCHQLPRPFDRGGQTSHKVVTQAVPECGGRRQQVISVSRDMQHQALFPPLEPASSSQYTVHRTGLGGAPDSDTVNTDMV